MSKENVLQKLYQAKKGINRPPYKRVFITGSPKEFKLRLYSTEAMDPKGLPFAKTWLHGGFFHPNYENAKYPSNFRCGGRGCPLCSAYKAEKEEQKNLPREKQDSWKKRSSPYALYWGENVETGDLCLIHVSDSAPQGVESIQEKLFNAIVEQVEKGINPMDLDEGMVLELKVRIVDKKVKLDISFDTKLNAINPEHRKVLKELPVLSTVYKTLSEEHLQCIADGEKIDYGNNNQSAKKMKESLDEVNEVEDDFKPEETESLSDGEELLQDDSFLEEDEFVMPEDDDGDDGFEDTLNNLLKNDED